METYRFNFSDEFKQSLVDFSVKQINNDLEIFKDNYEIWYKKNLMIIEDERIMLQRFGFDGNMENKIFKSIRYYFMKRSCEKESKHKERKKYMCKDNVFLNCVKDHITSVIKQKLKPSMAYNDFSEKYKDELVHMNNNLINNYSYDEKDANKKIKKIYQYKCLKTL